MRKFALVFGLLIAVLAITTGIALAPKWKQTPKQYTFDNQQETADYQRAVELLDANKYDEALEIVHQYKNDMEQLSEDGLRWMELFIKGSEATKDSPQLIVLFEYFPEIFKEHENASLLVADYYIANNQSKDYKKVRSLWEDRETQVATWYLLDVDQLLLEGRRQEAIDQLKKRTFKDKKDVGRLVRLALLYSDDDPKTAWKYLGEAYSKDPKNTDVRLYRAKLLETAGKYNLAHREYQEATRLEPDNIFLKDQLADFYLRQKKYPLAIEIWSENLSPPSLDKIWVKALFWEKVTSPLEFDWNKVPPPQGRLEPLIQYMMGLNDRVFWDQKKFDHLPNKETYLRTQQETYWLRLISALKNKNEKEAAKLLKYSPFVTNSWNPEMERALKRVLAYRTNGSVEIEPLPLPVETMAKEPQVPGDLPLFFQQLEDLANTEAPEETKKEITQKLNPLLKSNEVFSTLFLAGNWKEAGLDLHEMPVIPEDFPDWVAFNLTVALQQNRTTLDALEFASTQKQTPELTLLTAELSIAGGDSDKSLEKLNTIAKLDSPEGSRAAWLASLIYIEKGDWKNARNTIIAQPQLVNTLAGKETLARIAYLEGDNALATKLYTAIEKQSPEARSYLARKAFTEKNWSRARELTEKLIEDYPDKPILKSNLQSIIDEQQKNEKTQQAADVN